MKYFFRKIPVGVLLILSVVFSVVLDGIFSYSVVAQENEEEDQIVYEDDEKTADDTSAKNTVVTETVVVSDTISKEITTTTQSDTDGDGIFDQEDQYPIINDHFIVKDDDRNGIVDVYEK
jgi:hypothetical protein